MFHTNEIHKSIDSITKQRVLLGIENVLDGGNTSWVRSWALEDLLAERASVRNAICISSGLMHY